MSILLYMSCYNDLIESVCANMARAKYCPCGCALSSTIMERVHCARSYAAAQCHVIGMPKFLFYEILCARCARKERTLIHDLRRGKFAIQDKINFIFVGSTIGDYTSAIDQYIICVMKCSAARQLTHFVSTCEAKYRASWMTLRELFMKQLDSASRCATFYDGNYEVNKSLARKQFDTVRTVVLAHDGDHHCGGCATSCDRATNVIRKFKLQDIYAIIVQPKVAQSMIEVQSKVTNAQRLSQSFGASSAKRDCDKYKIFVKYQFSGELIDALADGIVRACIYHSQPSIITRLTSMPNIVSCDRLDSIAQVRASAHLSEENCAQRRPNVVSRSQIAALWSYDGVLSRIKIIQTFMDRTMVGITE